MNCARAMVTNNSILRVGTRCERETATQPFSLAFLTEEHRAAGRRRGATRTGASPFPMEPLPFRSSDSGRSVDQLAGGARYIYIYRRDSGMPGLHPTRLPHFALSIPSTEQPLSCTSMLHSETSAPTRSLRKSSFYTENEHRRCKLVICHG